MTNAMSAREPLDLLRHPSNEARPAGPRIGIIYPSGWGNLGDEAIMQSTFEALRERWPNADLCAFTLHPQRTSANHHVRAEYLTGINLPMFLSARDDGPFVVRAAKGVARRTRSIPVIGRLCQIASDLTASVVFEAASLKSARAWLKTADIVLAAGGGQLDAVWGGAWGQPYALARWAWLARRARVPFAFLSVGYGGARTRMSKYLLRYAVSRSAYCSVRDLGSQELTKRLGAGVALPVVPDLAFRLQPKAPLLPRRPGYDVGISPMAFMRPGSWPDESRSQYDRYVSLWADLVATRAAHGDRVHLFVTDPADMRAVEDVWAMLAPVTRERCSIAKTSNPDELLELFRRLDLVVSSRLHGVLLAIVAARPVLALSHERKVRAVMHDADASAFCVDLPTTSSREVGARFVELCGQLAPVSRRLREYVAGARAAIKLQETVLPTLLRPR